MKRYHIILIFSLVFLLIEPASAQCVMCKAVGEQSSKLDGLGVGLNSGILFLMAIPYILMATGALLMWKRFNKEGE
ncbi:MAG: hypothetical protein CL823_01695 [Crocinitomicaceae bacterium]|nr:hypothetical protein [Crocinitomicaceae bacterium]